MSVAAANNIAAANAIRGLMKDIHRAASSRSSAACMHFGNYLSQSLHEAIDEPKQPV